MEKSKLELVIRAVLADETGRESQNDPSRSSLRFGIKDWGVMEPGEAGARERYAALWIAENFESYSLSLGYYLFDLSIRFNPVLAFRWLKLGLGLDQLADEKQVRLRLEQLTTRDVILLMEVYVRRRLKSEPQWPECKHWWTNRANRARDRAVKWSLGESDEDESGGGIAGRNSSPEAREGGESFSSTDCEITPGSKGGRPGSDRRAGVLR